MAIEKLLYRFLEKFERPEEEVKISNRFDQNGHQHSPSRLDNTYNYDQATNQSHISKLPL